MSYVEELRRAHRERLSRLYAGRPKVQPEPEPEPEVPEETVETVENSIATLQPEPPIRPRATVRQIAEVVARRYRLTLIDIASQSRQQRVCLPRQIVMWLARRLTLMSMPQIGRVLGGRDHTTVLHAVRKIERLRAEDIHLQALLDDLEREITGELPE